MVTLNDPILVDLFCGGGGMSHGIEQAFREAGIYKQVGVAINHDQTAIAVHTENHPHAIHFREDIMRVCPDDAAPGRRVLHIHASPSCTHFSKARGGRPKSNQLRSLPWVVVRWARKKRPTFISVENVREMADSWEPVEPTGKIPPGVKNKTFRSWIKAFEILGYQVEWRVLNASDYGAPTDRERLVVLMRNDGKPIVWETPTHGVAGKPAKHAVSECIDWSIPMCSIFATPDEAKAWAKKHKQGVPKRPLAEATMRRIAKGLDKFVIKSDKPFLVPVEGAQHVLEDIRVSPDGEGARRVAAFMAQFTQSSSGGIRSLERPMPTMCTKQEHVVVAASLMRMKFDNCGSSMSKPCPTITAGGDAKRPAGAAHSLGVQAAVMVKLYGTSTAQPLDLPSPTVTAGGGHLMLVSAWLSKFYGTCQHGQGVDGPIHTIPTTDRFVLCTCVIDGQTYAVVDILIRMLAPHELKAAQGFLPEYVLERANGKNLPKSKIVKLIGNSVPPALAQSFARANVVPLYQEYLAGAACAA